MKTTHTKGEWKVNTDNDGDINTVFSVYHGAICSFPKFYGVKKTEDGNKELEANAKLIAAAPDLLEACYQIRDWCERNREKYFGTETPVCFSEVLSAIRKATN